MNILGIETSCDETSASVVTDGRVVRSLVTASSQELHKKYGGIVPEIASREQARVIIPVIDEALKQARVSWEAVDALAVTYGPGLIGSLLVGTETAKALAWVKGKPLFPVNHLLGHIYGAFLRWKGGANSLPKIVFPLIALIVSGGHTDLLLMRGHNNYRWLGGTRDDACGEAFDKVARLLGLGYPGGPAISALAGESGGAYRFSLPRPMINDPGLDFSFSGLKTAIKKLVGDRHFSRADIAREFQEAVSDLLTKKAILAGKRFNVEQIVLCGGVSANKRLREKLSETARKEGLRVTVPDFSFSTDNGAMIASRAFFASPGSSLSFSPDPSLLF